MKTRLLLLSAWASLLPGCLSLGDASPATHEPSGLAAAVGSVSGGKALITLTVSSAKQSTPSVPALDTITELVDLP
jgi:hypothetical protein